MGQLGHHALSAVVIALLGGCAPHHRAAVVADQAEPDCSFRSAATCWSVGARFPAPPSIQPDRIKDSSSVLAMAADSAPESGAEHSSPEETLCRATRARRLTAPVPPCNSDLPLPRQRHTRRKPGPQSHGSSPPPRRRLSIARRLEGPTTARLPKGHRASEMSRRTSASQTPDPWRSPCVSHQ